MIVNVRRSWFQQHTCELQFRGLYFDAVVSDPNTIRDLWFVMRCFVDGTKLEDKIWNVGA